jgi:short-subunit dehydrogenase
VSYVALITGASAGIGEATARRLAREPDVELVLIARREARLRELADALGGATVIAEDLTDPAAHGRITEVVAREHGALHMLVNNAGASWRGTFADTGWANVARHMAIDFEAPVRLTEALLPLLRQTAAAAPAAPPPDRRVCIVNVSSTAGRIARPGSGAYSAAKFALAGWTDSLRAEERPHGVHVGLVLPGFVATEGFRRPAALTLDRLRAAGHRRGDPRRRPAGSRRALHAAWLRGAGGRPDARAESGPPGRAGGCVHHHVASAGISYGAVAIDPGSNSR